ncbi:MAG: GFA family protein [Leptolyngbya sp. SIO1E4]|nr:GFA family protein [Leptolyngbya sp. SIO1E4]
MPTKQKTVSGGCLCGSIRYQLSETPLEASYCHCRMCQKNSGSAFAIAALFNQSALQFIGNEPTWYQSSQTARRGFCPTCGTPILFQKLTGNKEVSINIGTLDDPNAITPEYHYGIESELSWLKIEDDLPRYQCES